MFFLDDYVLHMWPELEPTNSKPDKYKQTTKWFQKKKILLETEFFNLQNPHMFYNVIKVAIEHCWM